MSGKNFMSYGDADTILTEYANDIKSRVSTKANQGLTAQQIANAKANIDIDKVPNVATNDQTPTFLEESTRTNIASGDKLSLIFGKIKKFFSDFKPVAFSGSYNDLSDIPTLVECSTARNVAAKTVTLPGFKLKTGARISVRFTDTSSSNPASGHITLNVNGTGAKEIVDGHTNMTILGATSGWIFNANLVNDFIYDGTYWVYMNRDNNTLYSAMSKAELTTGTATSLRTVRADYLKAGIEELIDGKLPTVPTKLSDLDDDSTHRTVTDTEKSTWNGKSNFSGSYNDLSNKPTIPSKLSDLSADATHRTVSDAEKSTWNGKANTSDIPTALSQLTADSTHRVVTDTEKTTWNGKANKKTQLSAFYGTCTTAAATQAKVATITDSDDNFSLRAGVNIFIKFTNTNSFSVTADTPITLNVNNTGAKQIRGAATAVLTGTNTTYYGRANYINQYVYDGTYWVWVGSSVDNNSTYSTMSTSELTTGTATTARSVRADYLKAGINSLIDTKIGGLDVASVGGSGKYISAISETDGKISATASNMPTIPEQLSDLTDDSTHRLVTDTEKSTWNGKSNFSGSYNDLTNKPTIPDVIVESKHTSIDNIAANSSKYSSIATKKEGYATLGIVGVYFSSSPVNGVAISHYRIMNRGETGEKAVVVVSNNTSGVKYPGGAIFVDVLYKKS